IGTLINDKDMYINELIDITRTVTNSVSTQNIKNFYNSDNNATLIKLFDFMKDIVKLVNIRDLTKIADIVAKTNKYDAVIAFLNDVGSDYVIQHFIGNTLEKLHNIIKTIIFRELYIKQEKTEIVQILINIEYEKEEFKYIDIVVPKNVSLIDYSVIESVLTPFEKAANIADDIINLLQEYETKIDTDENVDIKISELFTKQLVVPIVDDFVRYHKDTEIYDKSKIGQTKSKKYTTAEPTDKSIKKDNTKIRYIVTKINKVTDYFSTNIKNNANLQREVAKLFYQPLIHRRAVLINEREELDIIHRLESSGSKAVQHNEFYADLKALRSYPFVNFKEFRKYGFNIRLPRSVDAIRYVNIENAEKGLNNMIELRIAGKDMRVNVVGVMFKSQSHHYRKNPLNCLSLRDLESISTADNGYLKFKDMLISQYLDNKPPKKSPYWIFDIDKDIIETDLYVDVSSLNFEEYCKMLLVKTYDDLSAITFDYIMRKLDTLKHLSYYVSNKIIAKVQQKLVDVVHNRALYNQLQYAVYYDKKIHVSTDYDIKEDNIPGISSVLIKLPTLHRKHKKENIVVVKDVELYEESAADSLYDTATCQHFLSWNKISMFRTKQPNKFHQLFFEFYNKYIMVVRDEFICRSCKSEVADIKKHVADYQGDDTVTISLAISVPLEEMTEYENYNISIKNIDNLISKIANSSNISQYTGNDVATKYRRQTVTKQIIDLILLHYKTLNVAEADIRKSRMELAIKKYGIKSSDFFLFPLNNSIFVFSSKDTDKFKIQKFNNIICHIIFAIIIDLSASQILYFNYGKIDKICNFYLYDKYNTNLFDNILIHINNGGDLQPIKQFPLLCYVIFYMSCIVNKIKQWRTPQQADVKLGKQEQAYQSTQNIRKIINTLVDLINSILDINTKKEKNYLYSTLATRFFIKLKTLYNDNNLLVKIRDINDKNRIVDKKTNKIRYVNRELELPKYKLTGEAGTFSGDMIVRNTCKVPLFYMTQPLYEYSTMHVVNILTNCASGDFHDWSYKGDIKCKKCSFLLKDISDKKHADKSILDAYYYAQLSKLAEIYCPSGSQHQIDIATQKCKQCEKHLVGIGKTYTREELDKLKHSLYEKRQKYIAKIEKRKQKIIEYDSYIENSKLKVEKKIMAEYKEYKNSVEMAITSFINLLESIIGVDININNSNLYLRYTTYIIDHDHMGNSLKDPVILSDKDNKIIYKPNDPFFKINVMCYRNKSIDVDVYYNAINLNLIGYKEINRDYVKIYSNKYLRINLSLFDKIKYLGFNRLYLNVENSIDELHYIKNKSEVMKLVLFDAVRTRFYNLKKMVVYIQKIVYQIKYKYSGGDALGISRDYIKKFKTINIADPKSPEDVIFEDWPVINEHIFFKSIDIKVTLPFIEINNKPIYLYTSDIIDIMDKIYPTSADNLLIYYIISELTKLIKFNGDKFTQTYIVHLIIDIFEYLYKQTFVSQQYGELLKFKYQLETTSAYTDVEYQELEEKLIIDQPTQEAIDESLDKTTSLIEADDALDVEVDEDDKNDDFGDEDVMYESSDIGENSEDTSDLSQML
ncbi:MAG: hypothetical protein Faunusvirus37_5, partial [Faunusvirus sp.]